MRRPLPIFRPACLICFVARGFALTPVPSPALRWSLPPEALAPGCPAADLLFSLSFSAFLRANELALHFVDYPPLQTLPCASWADDLVRMLAAASMCELVDKVALAIRVSTEQAASAGIRFSFEPHKTAVLFPGLLPHMRLRPADSAAPPENIPFCNSVTGETHVLTVVSVYRHLGTIASADGSPRLELRYRRALALKPMKPFRTRLFARTDYPLPVRSMLLRSLSVSRFTYASAALNLSCTCHRKEWNRAYVEIWRGLSRPPRGGEHCPHAYEVLWKARAPSPAIAIALARAGLLSRLVRFGPSLTLWLLQAHWESSPKTSWLGLLRQDLEVASL